MKCLKTKHVYCYCEYVLRNNDKCPFMEIKKIIEKCKNMGVIDVNELSSRLTVIRLVELFDKIEVVKEGDNNESTE